MTYHYLKCPHCRHSLGRVTGHPSYIGNPIRKCPYCGGIYIDSFTREWVTKSPFSRFTYYISWPLSCAFLSYILITGILIMIFKPNPSNVPYLLLSPLICIIPLFCFILKRQITNTKEEIQQSLERTKIESYVKLLEAAKLKIYPIKGVEIGTVKDYSEEGEPTEIKETLSTTFVHH
ncbi:MAG: zf-TFIIB domain-containing protein [Clostridiales bacterium]|nr:zf-TFIIB domain-containing protein [Clostridiales bacterium]